MPSPRARWGLTELVGRVVVIDYPGAHFCVFAEPDAPDTVRQIPFASASLRDKKLFVPVAVGSYRSDAIVFDTGSSEMALNVDRDPWLAITGRTTTEGAPSSLSGKSWGKTVTFAGAPADEAMMLGAIDLGTPVVFTKEGSPTDFAGWPFRAEGVLGNRPLWDGIVVLDLTARMRIGLAR